MKGIIDEFGTNMASWQGWLQAENPEVTPMPGEWNDKLNEFQKLMLLRAWRLEKLTFAMQDFVGNKLGKQFTETPPLDLNDVFPSSNHYTPLIFILSSGADPMGSILRFADKMDYTKRMQYISLGQGQGKIAQKLITEAKRTGDWVVLQNCHLAKSWMPALELELIKFQGDPEINEGFRLWLTSMPAAYFPVLVLQNSVKMTFEPPQGLRANMKGTWSRWNETDFENCTKTHPWKKLLMGLTFFHALILERRKFGPLGWNIRYDWNDTDNEVSVETLRMFLDEQDEIPWEALQYVTGQINYGGRVTDDWDRRCLMCALRRLYNNGILEEDFSYCDAPHITSYYSPTSTSTLQEFKDYVSNLPIKDPVEVFGLHENAAITFDQQNASLFLQTITDIQPRMGGGGAGKSSDEVVSELAAKLSSEMPGVLTMEEAGQETFEPNAKGDLNSLQIVLQQEMDRFNKLIKVVKRSLVDIGKAIQGLVVMSAELDLMFNAMLINAVPEIWKKAAYPSLKPLSSWVVDFHARIRFMRTWLQKGAPFCYTLPYIYYPQGFMTGSLQMHARKYAIPIDSLNFGFEAQDMETAEDVTAPPEDGVYVDGFFMDGARFDRKKKMIEDSHPGHMYDTVPVIHFGAVENRKRDPNDYESPLYKTSVRAGILSTTGQSTNFVIAVDLKTDKNPEYWVLKGAALLCALND